MALKAVGFDIDGTLYPEWRIRWRSMFFFAAHLRLILAFAGVRREMRLYDGENPKDVDAWEVRLLARRLKLGEAEARRQRDRVIYGDWESHFRNLRIHAQVKESLQRLKGKGLKLAILSDFPVGRKLEYFGLSGLFDVVLGFPESGGLKPHSRPFITMRRLLGVEPSEILYVGNKMNYDFVGAGNAGMRAALLLSSRHRKLAGVQSFRNYRDLAKSILAEMEQ